MGTDLPEDVLHLICDELQRRDDYATLYNCAVAGKLLAPIAVAHLYRMQRSSENEDEIEASKEQQVVQRWSVFWRSVCLASMGQAMFPYHSYLRSLDLRDLEYLLTDEKFRGKEEKTFFKGSMAEFHSRMTVKMRRGEVERLNVPTIVEAIGEAIALNSNLLEVISGKCECLAFTAPSINPVCNIDSSCAVHQRRYEFPKILPDFLPTINSCSRQLHSKESQSIARRLNVLRILRLPGMECSVANSQLAVSLGAFLRWVPNFSRLKRIELYDGEILADVQMQNAIHDICLYFEALSIYQWTGADADSRLAAFINKLQPHTLKDLTTYGDCGVSSETCSALSRHAQSMEKLELTFRHDTIEGLGSLATCPNITHLQLQIPRSTDLERSHHDIFMHIAAWLGDCKKLKSVTLKDFKSAPTLLTPVLLNDEVQLNELNLNVTVNWTADPSLETMSSLYAVRDNRDFHYALAHQQSLQTLRLSGDDEDVTPEDLDALISSIGQLSKLKRLKLQGVSDMFRDDEMIRMLSPLQDLEEVYVGGWNITDTVLDTVANLKHLRAITFTAVASFTAPGLLDFVSKLAPSNEGMHFSIDNADPSNLLGEEELALVRSVFSTQISGRLEYIPLRDPNVSDFEGDSD